MKRSAATLFGVAIAIVCAAGVAAGQERPERPYRGLFGGGGDSSDMEQSLTATASVGAGFIYPIVGEMRTMPGLGKSPGGLNVDFDENGDIQGLS